jgi:DNA polymerase I-like protein with 3'-5' exonuclease and polymerase domains
LKLGDEVIGRYNSYDTWTTARLAQHLLGQLESHHQLPFYKAEIEPVIPAILALGRHGLLIDQGERTRLRRSFRAEVHTQDQLLATAAGHPYTDPYEKPPKVWFNPNSDTQVRRWLFGGDKTTAPSGAAVLVAKGVEVQCLGLKPAGKTEGGQWSVDLTNLVRVVRDLRKGDEPVRPILYALCHRTRYVKLDEYLDFDIDSDGRVRPTWKLHGTKSFRLAVANPPIHSWAEELRSMVVAAPGYVLVKADLMAVEARMAAYLSDDKLDIAVYERSTVDRPYKHHPGWDIHSALVLECFPELTEPLWAGMTNQQREPYRNTAKTIRFGTLLYGGAPETAQTKVFCPCPLCADKTPPTIDLTPTRKRAIVDRWMSRHQAFVRWRSNLLRPFEGPHATYCLRMPIAGWPVWFFQPMGGELQRELFNRPIQMAANLLKLRALRRLHAKGMPILIDHHDALVAEVPLSCENWAKSTFVECMTQPVEELGGVRFPVDVASGPTWADLH